MKAIYNWDNVNWEEQDIVISKNLGCSRERVRQKRILLGEKPSPFYHRRNCSALKSILETDTECMTADEVAKKFSCNATYAKNILRANDKKFVFVDKRKGGKYDWDKADWNKRDKDVALDLGVPNPGTVTQHRIRLGIMKERVRISAEKNTVRWVQKEKVQ